MGLGKTVQTLARIVEGIKTEAERKAGYRGGTIYVPFEMGDHDLTTDYPFQDRRTTCCDGTMGH